MRNKAIIMPSNHETKRKESIEKMSRIHCQIMLRNLRSKLSFITDFARGLDKQSHKLQGCKKDLNV